MHHWLRKTQKLQRAALVLSYLGAVSEIGEQAHRVN
jgi:hypothetical protein